MCLPLLAKPAPSFNEEMGGRGFALTKWHELAPQAGGWVWLTHSCSTLFWDTDAGRGWRGLWLREEPCLLLRSCPSLHAEPHPLALAQGPSTSLPSPDLQRLLLCLLRVLGPGHWARGLDQRGWSWHRTTTQAEGRLGSASFV